MWDAIVKFIMPVLQSALSNAATQGVQAAMAPGSPGGGSDGMSIRDLIASGRVTRGGLQSGTQNPGDFTGQSGQTNQGGYVPQGPAGVLGAGSPTRPSSTTSNFGGGYTGVAQANPYSQSGFQAMGYPTQDQARMRQMLAPSGGFQGI